MKLKDWVDFFGKRVVFYLAFSSLVGFALFFVELGFAYTLQLFLLVLGVASKQALQLPEWASSRTLYDVLFLVAFMAIARGMFTWAQEFMRGSSVEYFRHHQRLRLLQYTYQTKKISSKKILNLFGECLYHGGGFIKHGQVSLVQISSTFMLALSLFYLSPLITSVALVLSIAIGFIMKRNSKKFRDSGVQLVKEWEKTNNRLLLSLRNFLFIRIYGLEKAEFTKASRSLGLYLEQFVLFHKFASFFATFPQSVGIILVCFLTFLAKKNELLHPGALLTYFYLFIRFLNGLSVLASSFPNLLFEGVHIKDLLRWYQENAKKLHPFAEIQHSNRIESAIGLRAQQVTYWYEENNQAQKTIFKDLDLTIEPGTCCVLIGPSGAGKSTLLNLFLGELEPQHGSIEIRYNNQWHALKQNRQLLLDHIGYVGPEPFLIEGSILENLQYGLNEEITEDQAKLVLQLCECSFALEMGLKHSLTDQGQGLSAGQKQRLMLARALLRKPKILILDEATANLDFETEEKLIDFLNTLRGKMTILAVTHRAALLRIADQVKKLASS